MITDTDDIPITYLTFTQAESSDGAVFTVRVPCLAGQVLKASENSDVAIFGRPAGVGSYVDLFTDPIALDPYAGTDQDFDLFLRTEDVDGIASTAVVLTAGHV